MKFKGKLVMALITLATGAALVKGGSLAIFTAAGATPVSNLQAGNLKVISLQGDTCGQNSGSDVSNLTPGNSKTSAITIENDGSLDAWVGLENTLSGQLFSSPTGNPVQVAYTITVYQGTVSSNSQSEPDSNGDYHSHCHTGSKFRGAGGEDKGDSDPILATLSRSRFTTSDTTPMTPFKLPVGDYAIVTYTYNLASGADHKYVNTSSHVSVKVDAVQVRNNDQTSGPSSWNSM